MHIAYTTLVSYLCLTFWHVSQPATIIPPPRRGGNDWVKWELCTAHSVSLTHKEEQNIKCKMSSTNCVMGSSIEYPILANLAPWLYWLPGEEEVVCDSILLFHWFCTAMNKFRIYKLPSPVFCCSVPALRCLEQNKIICKNLVFFFSKKNTTRVNCFRKVREQVLILVQ